MKRPDDRINESLDRLVPARDESSDWNDVLARLQSSPAAAPHRPRSWWLVPIAAVLAAAAAALIVTTPWTGGPSVVAKANAAIAVTSAADVLHERATFAPLVCLDHGRVEKLGTPHCHEPLPSSIELWVEGGGGQRSFRTTTRTPLPPGWGGVLAPPAPFGNALAWNRSHLRTLDIGGTLGPAHVIDALVLQHYSNTLIRFTQAPTAIPSDAFDPVALVRRALATGHARVAGDAVVDGRKVLALDVQLHDLDGHPGTATYYVDRSSYAPVEIVYRHVDGLQFPYVPVFDPNAGFSGAIRFSTFERIPATATARALTNIRAQHKTAKVVCGQEFGLPDC